MSDESRSFLSNYEQVDEFDIENEGYEEETFYVTLDLGQLDPHLLPNATSYRMIGLETDTPFLQIGRSTFKGEYETLLGTEIVLKEPALNAGPSRHLAPVATTDQRIRFREVKLIPKSKTEMDWTADEEVANAEKNASIPPKKTLGGVSRETQATFLPASKTPRSLALLDRPKGKRRWHKRPEGYHTSDEEKEKEEGPIPGENREQSESSDGEDILGQSAEGVQGSGAPDS